MPKFSPRRTRPPARPRAVLLAALAMLAAAAVLAPAGASARVSSTFVGINPITLGSSGDFCTTCPFGDGQLKQEKSLRIGVVRTAFSWADIETSPGNYDFSYTDRNFRDAARHGMSLLPILYNPPSFRAKPEQGNIAFPPNRAADMGTFGAKMVGRYGPKGSFFKGADARYRKYAIHSWQVWNEPNLAQYWGGRPNAGAYVKLLAATSKAIKQVDRHAEIVTAGIPFSSQHLAISAKIYIPQMLKAHAARYFNTLAINAYSHTPAGVFKLVSAERKNLNKFGGKRAQMWVTEVGWSDVGPKSPYKLGAKGQANAITGLFKLASKERGSLKLRGLVYYNWQDLKPGNRGDFPGNHQGLVTRTGKRKLAYNAFAKAVRSLR